MSIASYKVRGKISKKEEKSMNYFQRLKDLREDNDLTQKDIAKLLGTTRQQVGKWENGVQMMGIDKYIVLSRHYNVSLDYLAGIIDTPVRIDKKKELTPKELALLRGYKTNKDLQKAIDKLLDI